jgi:hypothetical protein
MVFLRNICINTLQKGAKDDDDDDDDDNNNNNNNNNAGTGNIGTINSNDRIAATMCTLGTRFVSGIYINTL